MARKFKTFTIKVNDKDVEFKLYEPSIEDYKEAAKARNIAFMEALTSKAPLRAQINTLLRARGEWDDEREAQYNDYSKQILELDRKLKIGGIKLKEGRDIALKMRKLRNDISALLTDKSSLDNMTAEGQADNTHFNALVAACLVYNNEQGQETRYFNSVDDYLVNATSEIAAAAAKNMVDMLYTIGDKAQKALPENQFLLKYKFINDDLALVNKDGKLIDEDGRLIDKDGRFINEQGEFVDKFGNKVNDAGEYVVNSSPFLDDDGQPIAE